MKNNVKRIAAATAISISLVAAIGMGAYAVPEKPAGSGGSAPGGAPGQSSANVSHAGANTFDADATIENQSYQSSSGGQNAVLITAGAIDFNSITVNKSGDENGEDSDFYGTNAAILATGGETTITNSTVETSGAHANAVFANGDGVIRIKDSTIKTSQSNSGGIMVTGGGTLIADNLTVSTAGNSAAAIRSDRGGGTMTISGGTYKTSGKGSPAIYSTAGISVKDATLDSSASEGVVIEGKNSVELDNVNLTDTNNTLNGNSETYKNIFIYQSMSGDADEGVGSFTAQNSQITTNQGDHFFITNTTATINLENNTYTNNDTWGAFLTAAAGKWGQDDDNGGIVTLNLTYDEVKGDINIDGVSSLIMNLTGGSYYRGLIDGVGAKSLSLTQDDVYVLDGDTSLESLVNGDETNQNIYGNGHTLTVAGKEVATNPATPPEGKTLRADDAKSASAATENSNNPLPLIFTIVGAAVALGAAAVITVKALQNRKKNGKIDTIDGENKNQSETNQ